MNDIKKDPEGPILGDNVLAFFQPAKAPPPPNLDVEWFYDEAEFFSEWMDEFDW